jgi:hypothetical protein
MMNLQTIPYGAGDRTLLELKQYLLDPDIPLITADLILQLNVFKDYLEE